MDRSEIILRLLAENYELKDKLTEEKNLSDYWYKKCSELEAQRKSNTSESNEFPGKEVEKELPLTPEGLKNKCKVEEDSYAITI